MGTYSTQEWLDIFGGWPEPGETYPDDPDRLRDDPDLKHSAHVLGQRDNTSLRPFANRGQSLPPAGAGGRSGDLPPCGACGAPRGVACSPSCESNR